uniref:Uncharacterized protein n=1 Tax=viral metagenome TaxID=1070528 RepID=A0A6C0BGI5_9ZZZZ
MELLMKLFDPYTISLLLFTLVTINACIDVNTRLIELGSLNTYISRGRLMWYYFTATFSYILKTIVALFVIFCMISIIIVIIVGILSMIKSGAEISSNKATSKDAIMGAMKATINAAITKYVRGNIDYMYTYLLNSRAIIIYFIIFPIFMLVLMTAFATSIYQPAVVNTDDEENASSTSLTTLTTHHYLYFMFVVFVMSMIIFIVYDKMI